MPRLAPVSRRELILCLKKLVLCYSCFNEQLPLPWWERIEVRGKGQHGISRRERNRTLGFDGPYTGGRHEFMLREDRRLILPNPHRGDISVDLLVRLLQQAGITHEEWQSLT